MKIRILTVGTKAPSWVNDGVKEYVKRLPRDFALSLVEVPAAKRSKRDSPANVRKLTALESEKLQASVQDGEWRVALDEHGLALNSQQLARKMSAWQERGSPVVLLIGGADGLSDTLLDSADETLSLSPMTLPHYLVRVVLVEALYRAWSILSGHPYHRE